MADIVNKARQWEIAAFIDDDPVKVGSTFLKCPVWHSDELQKKAKTVHVTGGIVAVGDARTRQKLAQKLTQCGLKLVTIIHPSAVVADGVEIGDGTVVMASAVVNPAARMGKLCVINTGATVDHDCVLGDLVQIAPGAHLGGTVKVGEGTLVGIGASVKQNIAIGKWSVIGVGATVVSDIPDNVVAYGVPATVQRNMGKI